MTGLLSPLWKSARALLTGSAQPKAAPVHSPPGSPSKAYLNHGKSPLPKDGYLVKSLDELIDLNKEVIAQIKSRATLPNPGDWEDFYMGAIRRFAAYVHLLPASENNHHREPGGLLAHSLEVAYLTMIEGYNHAPDIDNFPSLNRKLQIRYPYACFLAGLLHDFGKPATDFIVTDPSGEIEWRADVMPLLDWLTQRGIDIYYVYFKKGRGTSHKTNQTLPVHDIIGRPGLEYLSSIGGGLSDEFWASLAAETMPAIRNLGQYRFKADGISCERYTTRFPYASTSEAGSVPAYLYVDAIQAAITEREWIANNPNGPLWFIKGTLYLQWTKGCDAILRRLPSDARVPRQPATVKLSLGQSQVLITSANKGPYIHLVLPKSLEDKGQTDPIACVAFSAERTKAFYDLMLPASEEGRIVQAQNDDPPAPAPSQAALSSPASSPAAATPPATQSGKPATPPATAPTPGPKPAPPAMPHPPAARPAAAPAPPVSPTGARTAPPDLDMVFRSNDDTPPPDEDYLRYIDEANASTSAASVPNDLAPKSPAPIPPPPAPAKAQLQPAAPPRPAIQSKPSMSTEDNRDAINARRWFQTQDGLLYEELLTVADKVVAEPRGVIAGMLAVKNGLVVLSYPDLPKALRADGWRKLMSEYSNANLLYSGHPDPTPIRSDYGFAGAVVLDRDISRKFIAVLGAYALQDVANIDPRKRAPIQSKKPDDLDLFKARDATSSNKASQKSGDAIKDALAQITAPPPPAPPAAAQQPPKHTKPDPIDAVIASMAPPTQNITLQKSNPDPVAKSATPPNPPKSKQDIDPTEVGFGTPDKVLPVEPSVPLIIDQSMPSKWNVEMVKLVLVHLYEQHGSRERLFLPAENRPDHIEAPDHDIADLLTDDLLAAALPKGHPPAKGNRRQLLHDWISLKGNGGIFVGRKVVTAAPRREPGGPIHNNMIVFRKGYLNAR